MSSVPSNPPPSQPLKQMPASASSPVTHVVTKLLKNFGREPETLRIDEETPGVLRVRLHRPHVRNAFNESMIVELTEILALATDRLSLPEFRVLVLAGEGAFFCAGADLEMMQRQGNASPEDNLHEARRLGTLFETLARVPVPVVCTVRGAAIGGGFGLAVCADVVLAESRAIFATSEVRLGLVPAVISPYIVRRLGLGASAYPLLTGARMSSEEAKTLGLVHEVAADSEALDQLLSATLRELLSAAPAAQRETKRLLQLAHPLPTQEVRRQTEDSIAAIRSAPEAKEGLSCFFTKKVPGWLPAAPATPSIDSGHLAPSAHSRDRTPK